MTHSNPLREGQRFRMRSGGLYIVEAGGAFTRLDKDRRPVKARKRARREARKAKAA